MSHHDSEIHALQNGNLERHEVWIEDRVQCRRCLRYHRPGETCCGYGRFFAMHHRQGQKKQAEQRISSRYIMYVLSIHDLALKNTHRGRRHGKSEK